MAGDGAAQPLSPSSPWHCPHAASRQRRTAPTSLPRRFSAPCTSCRTALSSAAAEDTRAMKLNTATASRSAAASCSRASMLIAWRSRGHRARCARHRARKARKGGRCGQAAAAKRGRDKPPAPQTHVPPTRESSYASAARADGGPGVPCRIPGHAQGTAQRGGLCRGVGGGSGARSVGGSKVTRDPDYRRGEGLAMSTRGCTLPPRSRL